MKGRFKRGIIFCRQVAAQFMEDACMYRASALTFTTLLALVPLIVVSISILSAFPVFESLGKDVQAFLYSHLLPESGDIVQDYLSGFVDQASHLSAVGIAFLIVTAVLMLYTIEQAFNAIWRVKRRRKGISAFMLYWAILTLSPFLIGLSMGLSAYVISVSEFSQTAAQLGLTEVMVLVVSFVLTTSILSLLYITIPNCNVPIRAGIVSAVFATIMFEIVKQGFTFYLAHFSTYQVLYGALAMIPIFLVWVYMLWLIILLGAEINRGMAFYYGYAVERQLCSFRHAFRWLGYLSEAQQAGNDVSLLELIKRDRCYYETSPEAQIHELVKVGYIRRTGEGRYFLSCDLSQLSLGDFYRALPWKLPSLNDDLVQIPWEQSLLDVLQQLKERTKDLMGLSLSSLYQASASHDDD